MSLGSDTVVVNGQRFTTPTVAQYRPASYGQQTTGVPQISPTMPPFIGGGTSGAGPAVYENVNGYGTSGNNQLVTAIAGENPHNLKASPLWWAMGSLLVGLWLLNAVHWRKTTLESVDAGAEVGPARAEAREAA